MKKFTLKRLLALTTVTLSALALMSVTTSANSVMAYREKGDPEQFSPWTVAGASIKWRGQNSTVSTGKMRTRVVKSNGDEVVNVLVDVGTGKSGSRISAPSTTHRMGLSEYWSQAKGSGYVTCPDE